MRPACRRAVPGLLLAGAVLWAPGLKAQQPKGPPTAFFTGGPEPGDLAPSFELPQTRSRRLVEAGAPFRLRDERGSIVVLAFYPHDYTVDAATLLRELAHRSPGWEEVTVAGVSGDSLARQVRYAAELQLPFSLLSDPDLRVARRYGARDPAGYARRAVYVLDREGKVAWRDLRFDPASPTSWKQLDQVVAALAR